MEKKLLPDNILLETTDIAYIQQCEIRNYYPLELNALCRNTCHNRIIIHTPITIFKKKFLYTRQVGNTTNRFGGNK